MNRRMLTLLLGLFMLCLPLLSACDKGSGESDAGDALIVWTFSDDTATMVNDYYLKAYPDKKVTVQVYPLEVFQTRLDGALRTGENVPDIVALEISFVKKYVESGALMDLSALGYADRAQDELYGYLNDIGTAEDGTLYALSSQATPGGFFYRRSMAMELWGDDSPEFVQEKLSTWDGFLQVAAALKADGDKRIVSNLNASQKVFSSQRSSGWVEDDRLEIDSVWGTYLDLIRTMQDNMYSNETTE